MEWLRRVFRPIAVGHSELAKDKGRALTRCDNPFELAMEAQAHRRKSTGGLVIGWENR
jgi:hypothetical protein